MTPTGRDIARYVSTLNRTAKRYRLARVQEFTAQPRNRIVSVPPGWVSNHTRIIAWSLARQALGSGRAWGRVL